MELVYGIKDRPPIKQNLVFALQQIIAIMAATLLVPILVGSKIGRASCRERVYVSV